MLAITEPLLAPKRHLGEDRHEAFADVCECIFHLWRNLAIDLTMDESVGLEFAQLLGASNPVMLSGRLPGQKEQLLFALDSIIHDIGEERLRNYRTNLRHL